MRLLLYIPDIYTAATAPGLLELPCYPVPATPRDLRPLLPCSRLLTKYL